jgi:polyisoprenoid-binding protein YceI
MAVTNRRRGIGLILALLAILILAGAGVGTWYLFFRSAGPAPVTLPSATPPATSGGGATPGAGGGDMAGGVDGTWSVDPSVGSFSDFSGSFVGYRVRETLASIGATEAVGRTPGVTGSLTVDGTVVTAAAFTADLTGLESDDPRRDGQLRRQALETSQYPTATFTLTSPVDLGTQPVDGTTVDVTATGDLALHGVTRSVEIPLQARVDGAVVTITGSLEIAFADFGIASPQAMIVLSVEDQGTLELQLQLTRG